MYVVDIRVSLLAGSVLYLPALSARMPSGRCVPQQYARGGAQGPSDLAARSEVNYIGMLTFI
jgi:hypothetical protein